MLRVLRIVFSRRKTCSRSLQGLLGVELDAEGVVPQHRCGEVLA